MPVCLQICHHIANGDEFMNILVLNGHAELFLAEHNQIGKLNGVDAKVGRQLRLGGNVLLLDLKLLNQQLLYNIGYYTVFLFRCQPF